MRRILLFTCLLLPAIATAESTNKCSEDHNLTFNGPYDMFHSDLGGVDFGLVLADFDGDSNVDLAVASGGDHAAQTVRVYQGDGNDFAFYPRYYSNRIGFYGGMAAADLAGDGHLDIIATTSRGLRERNQGGEVRVVRTSAAAEWATETIDSGFGARDVAIADFDADGRLDFAVAVSTSHGAASCPSGTGKQGIRVYLSQSCWLPGSCADFRDAWVSDDVCALGIDAADVNADGWIDLVASGPKLAVFLGGPSKRGQVPFSRTPWFSKTDVGKHAFGVDVGPMGCDGDPTVVVAGLSGTYAFRPPSQTPLFHWSQKNTLLDLHVEDLDHNGLGDLAISTYAPDGQPEKCDSIFKIWGSMNPPCGTVELFKGTSAGFGTQSVLTKPPPTGIYSRVGVSEMHPDDYEVITESFTSKGGPVFTLTDPPLSVGSVTVGGKPVGADRVVFAPGESWISVSTKPKPDKVVEVTYTRASRSDLVATDQNPFKGGAKYMSYKIGGTPP